MAEENKAMELHGEESEKKKYISDVLDIDKLIEEYGNKIMLIAGVGSGKSTWVKDVLTQKGNVLFITSRRAKVDEDIAHSCFTSFVLEQDGQRENLITNAKLGYILINAHADMQMTVDNFLNCYEYIVVDEIHSPHRHAHAFYAVGSYYAVGYCRENITQIHSEKFFAVLRIDSIGRLRYCCGISPCHCVGRKR